MRGAVRPIVVGGGSLLLITMLASYQGGFFSTAWGWSGIALCWAAFLALLLVGDVRLGAADILAVGALAGLTAWIFLSGLWSPSAAETLSEGERALIYIAAFVAVLVLVEKRLAPLLLGGVASAIFLVSGYALLTRLFPDRVGLFDSVAVYRLATPIGYWNGLGIFAALGVVLCSGFAARGKALWVRGVTGAATVPLLLTVYFTYSRGAWLSLVVGLLVCVAVDTRRLQLLTTFLVLAPWALATVGIASQERSLTHLGATLGGAVHEGHVVAAAALGLAVGAGLSAAAAAYLGNRLALSPRIRLAYTGALILVTFGLLASTFATYGSPPTLVRKGYDQFVGSGRTGGANLNTRLFDISNGGRLRQWKVAWREYKLHPVLGSGAGTYDRYWFRYRPVIGKVLDAHSLYIETLAELGPVGLLLLVAALAAPLLVLPRARITPLGSVAVGGYFAYLVHAAFDWDWELPAVTLAGLLCAAFILAAGRAETARPVLSRPRMLGAAVAVAAGAFALVGLVGNAALASSAAAFGTHDARKAEARARTAISWAPWSTDALAQLGWAQVEAHRRAAAAQTFRKALRKDPGDFELWLDLAFMTSGHERTHALARAKRLNPLFDMSEFRDALRELNG